MLRGLSAFFTTLPLFTHPMRLLARGISVEFIRHESFRSYYVIQHESVVVILKLVSWCQRE